jgi:hypothetical protein
MNRPAWLEAIAFGPDSGRLLTAIGSCPSRGPVLPVSQQAECGCSELTECRAGKGATPGRVSMDECLVCRIDAEGLRP